jgi:acetylornithine deacetylase/succinyl-diaminopimelate desuccinylase-like protein
MELDLIAAARDLIAANSVSARGNLAAIAVLERIAASLGLDSYRDEADALGTRHANLVVFPRGAPPEGGGLLLVTHTDTVGSGPRELWTETDPWTLKQDGDVLFGLGVADVKLDALAKLQALARAPAGAAGRVAFCGTFAEEVGCLGARHFVEQGRFRPAFAACGEPSELRIIDAHKGYLVARLRCRDPSPGPAAPRLRLTFQGRAAHSSTPHLGDNAIDRALAFCDAQRLPVHALDGGDLANKVPARCSVEVDVRAGLADEARAAGATVEEVAGTPSSAAALASARKVAGELRAIVLRLVPDRDARFDPDTVVFNLGVARGSGGEVELTCDARLLPGHDPAAIFAELERAAAGAPLPVEIVPDRSNPAMALPARSRLRDAAMDAARSCDLDPTPQAKPTNTEGGVFVSAGIEAIVFGPGRSTGNAHTANERQSESQLRRAIPFYEALVRNLCG